MRRGLAQLLPEGHQSIEKRSCKQPDSNARPKHQNVSFSATLPFRLGSPLTCTPYYGKCRTKFPDKVLGVLNIDLAKRVIQHLTGVATGSNA
jgi:hypothetical protein